MRGHVELNTYALGRRLQEIGVIGAGDTTTETVVAKLSYLLSWPDATPDLVRHYMLQSLRGELTEDVHGTALSATNAWTSLTRTERGDMLFTGLGRQNIASEYQAGGAQTSSIAVDGSRALSPPRDAKAAAVQPVPTPPPRKAASVPSADVSAAARAMDAPPISTATLRAPAPPPAQTLTPVPPAPRPPPRVAPATAAVAAAVPQRRVEEDVARAAATAATALKAAEETARAAEEARRRGEEEKAAELQRKRDRMLAAEAEIAAAEARATAATEVSTAATSATLRPCATCGKSGATFDCGGCRSVTYCSQDCQQQDWGKHEAVCGEPATTTN